MKRFILLIYLSLLISGNILAQNPENIETKELVKSCMSWDGNNLPKYPRGRPEITILRIKVPAGAVLPEHKHPVINAGVLLSGELTIFTEDNKILHLKAGDAIVEVVNKWHYSKNEGKEPAEIIVVYSGAQEKPVTIKKYETKSHLPLK